MGVLGYALASWVSTPVGQYPCGGLVVYIGIMGQHHCFWGMHHRSVPLWGSWGIHCGGPGVCIGIMGLYPCVGPWVCIGIMWRSWGMYWPLGQMSHICIHICVQVTKHWQPSQCLDTHKANPQRWNMAAQEGSKTSHTQLVSPPPPPPRYTSTKRKTAEE